MKLSAIGIGIALSFISATSLAARPAMDGVPRAVLARDLSAAVDQEERNRQIAFHLAPIKTRADLDRYTRSMPPSSPLRLLSTGGRQRFIASLTFNETGLTGYDYSDLVVELKASDIYRVLSLFGAQHTTALLKGVKVTDQADRLIMSQSWLSPYLGSDHEGYRCESHATCAENLHTICMSGC